MHPIHSDLVAGLIRDERLRVATAHWTVDDAPCDEAVAECIDAVSLVRRALNRFRGTAHVELRHHA